MADQAREFSMDLRCGEQTTLAVGIMERTVNTSDFTLGTEAKAQITSALVWVYDDDQPLEGTVDSATSGGVTDATLATATANKYKYLMLRFLSNTNLQGDEWQVGTSGTDGTLTLYTAGIPLPVTPAAGDTFTLSGYPLVAPTSMTVQNDGVAYFTVGPSNNVTTRPGRKVAKALLTYTDAAGFAAVLGCTWTINVTR